MSTIIFEIKDGIATIKLNRPKVYNSINTELARAFQQSLDEVANNENVRAVIITGTGKAFCTGQDIKEITDPKLNPGFRIILEKHYAPIVRKIRNLKQPVIAAVNGVAAGAGANIALACDIILATEKASFIQAFSGIGLIPDSAGTYTLPRLIGRAKASAIAMLGDRVSAKEAERIGMIYKYFEAENFENEVQKIADKLAHMPTKALALTKRAFNASETNTFDEQLDLETELQLAASETKDYQEGVTAFIEKRKPLFKGK
ncbi:MAG TPA: 2-(1,2-epoxy-1,2-dihydrophenyl)acetyl-CoA isomerase [Saprospiraceae bacterium]|nr:2-(1,2-epoxy-1,2-dihydrophenyl)acetyl-CoA isomerase [Saprospiraceae bacterium]